MWDLTIPDVHDFYVVTSTTPASIVAHNCTVGNDEFVGPMSKAESQGLQKGINPNAMSHIFGKSQHSLDGVVNGYGGEMNFLERMYAGLDGETPSEGEFVENMVNGVPRVGTVSIPK